MKLVRFSSENYTNDRRAIDAIDGGTSATMNDNVHLANVIILYVLDSPSGRRPVIGFRMPRYS